MRLRLALTAILAVAVLAVAASAQAYPWPLKPFNRQHPIRANFGDPRTRFWNTMTLRPRVMESSGIGPDSLSSA